MKKFLLILMIANTLSTNTHAIDYTFNYQGELVNNGSAADGNYDIAIQAYDSVSANNTVGMLSIHNNVTVSDGLFSIPNVNLGSNSFDGLDIWLQIRVKTPTDVNYTALSPLQKVQSVPYANSIIDKGATNGQVLTFNNATGWQPANATTNQNLSLSGNTLNISNGTSATFIGWDTNAVDDFSGDYTDLTNKPAIPAAATGLIQVTENNNTGYRLFGTNAGTNIGTRAVQLSDGGIGPTGSFSITTGRGTKASGSQSTAMGGSTFAEGFSSTALGSVTKATGDFSTAIGNRSRATGNSSTAMGEGSEASGDNSIALGSFNNATGKYSTAIGHSTDANGRYATSIGNETNANAYVSTAIGQYNVGAGTLDSWVTGDPLFEIGNGDFNTSNNAFTVLKDGKVGIGTHQPLADLFIEAGTDGDVARVRVNDNTVFYLDQNGGTSIGSWTTPPSDGLRVQGFTQLARTTDATLSNGTGTMVIGNENGLNLVFDSNEIMARNNGSTSPLYLQDNGGDVGINGSIVHTSDKRLKKDIVKLPYGLAEIMVLEPKAYNWKNREQKHKSFGFIAQEIQMVIKEIVHVRNNEEKTLSLSYTELIPVMINAMQEQQAIIDQQDEKINKLLIMTEQLTQLIKSK